MAKKPSFETYKKRLRNITRFKDLPEEEFEKVAQDLYIKKYTERQLEDGFIKNDIGVWLNETEAKQADKIFNTYIEKNSITNFSDIALLKNLVYYEIQLVRIQTSINESAHNRLERGKNANVPIVELRAMNEINEQILTLKKTLGLSDEKRGNNPIEYINSLKRKMLAWGKEQFQLSRFRKCPNCSQPLLLLMRPEAWEAYKHPFIKDRYLFNEHLWKLYKEGKITSLDMAKVLLGKDVKVDYYIKWLEEKLQNKIAESGDDSKESGSAQ